MQPRDLEICVETLQAVQAAVDGRADRIELCSALGEGGVTPSRALIRAALRSSPIPVHVLLRPRSGDFVYSSVEFEVICEDLEDALALGASGFVVGLLTASREIEQARMRELVKRAGGFPGTFHRAFDHTRDLFESLEMLVDLGCSRVLTSGGEPTVMEGIGKLERLAGQADGRLRVAAGGGVTLANASRLVEIEGLDLHASLRPKLSGAAGLDPLWRQNASQMTLSVDSVRQLSAITHGETAR